MDRNYQRLHESIRYGEARKKGFKDFDPLKLERFLSCFHFELMDCYSSTASPFMITCDYKIERESGRPVLIELERAPQNKIAAIAQLSNRCRYDKLERYNGFCRYVGLEEVMKQWSEFDSGAEVSFAPHLSVIADEKILTHDAFGDQMAKLIDIEQADPEKIVVKKNSNGARGNGVWIRLAGEFYIGNGLGVVPNRYFFEEYIDGKPTVKNGKEFETCYRVVCLVGLKNGELAVEPLTGYARVSSLEKQANQMLDVLLKVNVSSGENPATTRPLTDEENELLFGKSKEILYEFSSRAKENFKMSDLLGKKYLFNLSNARGMQAGDDLVDRMGNKRSQVIDEEFEGWAIYDPKWWGREPFFYINTEYQPTPVRSFLSMINLHQPELALVNDIRPVLKDDKIMGVRVDEDEPIDFKMIDLPQERVIVNPFKGLKPDELLGKIKKAKKIFRNRLSPTKI